MWCTHTMEYSDMLQHGQPWGYYAKRNKWDKERQILLCSHLYKVPSMVRFIETKVVPQAGGEKGS